MWAQFNAHCMRLKVSESVNTNCYDPNHTTVFFFFNPDFLLLTQGNTHIYTTEYYMETKLHNWLNHSQKEEHMLHSNTKKNISKQPSMATDLKNYGHTHTKIKILIMYYCMTITLHVCIIELLSLYYCVLTILTCHGFLNAWNDVK